MTDLEIAIDSSFEEEEVENDCHRLILINQIAIQQMKKFYRQIQFYRISIQYILLFQLAITKMIQMFLRILDPI